MDPAAAAAAADGVGEGVSKTYLVKRRAIFIPLFRKVPDDPQADSRIVGRPDQEGMLTSFTRPEAYLRHTKSAARTLGHVSSCPFVPLNFMTPLNIFPNCLACALMHVPCICCSS